MGQNLLVDDGFLKKIVQAARIDPGETIVEVGAGLGVLTEELARRGANVVALELDSGFFSVLQERFAASHQVELIHADAMTFDFQALASRVGKLRVVANLPYNISSRLIFTFLEHRDLFRSLHILLQREVAERFIAPPGTKDYGVLTVLLGVSSAVDLLFDIPAKAFYPVPEVVSTLVRVTFPDEPPVLVADARLLVGLVKASFAGRRKTLRNTLRNFALPGLTPELLNEAAEDAGIDLGRRGETLSPIEFARFADAIHARVQEQLP
ncbi:MAG: ribosomal RNA small subunit methyltransferase A [Desulfomonile tiedjei]|nr:ribosomal RNA small subunit methyltransferase A [Desulfomonile tiedjei]